MGLLKSYKLDAKFFVLQPLQRILPWHVFMIKFFSYIAKQYTPINNQAQVILFAKIFTDLVEITIFPKLNEGKEAI